MKQNLMQQQLKLTIQKPKSSQNPRLSSQVSLDFTSKAFFVYNELFGSQFLFNKKTLAQYLNGKSINLQQRNHQSPPRKLKGYMNMQEIELIEKMIEQMLDKDILMEVKITFKQRTTKRLNVVKQFQQRSFPKILVKPKFRKITSIYVKKEQQLQGDHQKSRFSLFIKSKNLLQVNILKKEEQMKMKEQKQRQEEAQRLRKLQEQIKAKKQIQMREFQAKKKIQTEVSKKQEQKVRQANRLNDFWLKQKQKIEQIVNLNVQNSEIHSPKNVKRKKNSQQQVNVHAEIQMPENILQIQMKQLKKQQQEKRNPIKPIFSYSFVKNTLGIDSSQSQKELEEKIEFEQRKQVIELHENDFRIRNKNNSGSEKASDSYSFKTNKITFTNNKKQTSSERISNLKQPSCPKLQIQLPFQDSSKNPLQRQQSPQSTQTNFNIFKQKTTFQNSFQKQQSAQRTKTNFNLVKIKTKPTFLKFQQNSHQEQELDYLQMSKDRIFAKTSEQSMFSNNFYMGRENTKTVKNIKLKEKKIKTQNENHFSFKGRSTIQTPEETLIETIKIPSQASSFEELTYFLRKKEKSFQPKKRLNKEEQDECAQTKTIAFPRKMTERVSSKSVILNHKNIDSEAVKLSEELFVQTITIPQPRIKHKKTTTEDLQGYAEWNQKKQEPKRDYFVLEIIADFKKGKLK